MTFLQKFQNSFSVTDNDRIHHALGEHITCIENKLVEVGTDIAISNERQKTLDNEISLLREHTKNLDRQFITISAEQSRMNDNLRQMQDMTDETKRIVQETHNLLNAHVGTEARQFIEYAENAAKNTQSLERLNQNLFKIAISGSILIVILSGITSKFDLLNKLGFSLF